MKSRDRLNQYCTSLTTANVLSDCTSSETSCRNRIIINTSTVPADKNATYFLRRIVHGPLMKQRAFVLRLNLCYQNKAVGFLRKSWF